MALIPFDDRDGTIWWDGEMLPWRDAKLHVLTHGLHYASAVFEGERAYAGNIFKLEAHTERLINSGKLLGFEIRLQLRKFSLLTLGSETDCKNCREFFA